jgi:hypothetical protein
VGVEVRGEHPGRHPDGGARRGVGAPGECEGVGDAGGERARAARSPREEEGGPRARGGAGSEREVESRPATRRAAAAARGRTTAVAAASSREMRTRILCVAASSDSSFRRPPFRGLICCVFPAIDVGAGDGRQLANYENFDHSRWIYIR